MKKKNKNCKKFLGSIKNKLVSTSFVIVPYCVYVYYGDEELRRRDVDVPIKFEMWI